MPDLPVGFIDGIGGPELMLVLLIALLLFGGDKLPELARGLGKSMREFKKATGAMQDELRRAMEEPEKSVRSIMPPDAPTPPPVPPPPPALELPPATPAPPGSEVAPGEEDPGPGHPGWPEEPGQPTNRINPGTGSGPGQPPA